MDQRPIDLTLKDASHVESEQSRILRQRAATLVATQRTARETELPDNLLEILKDIIRPLFASSQHKALTATGRKALIKDSLPSSITRFSTGLDERPVWKNGWCGELLQHTISQYECLDGDLRRKSLETAFHLMVPPILHQIDDYEIHSKCAGLRCLRMLCNQLYGANCDILKQSGLTDVFVEAMQNNFTLLPTLTSEEDSLSVLRELYPAFRATVKAHTRTDKPVKFVFDEPKTKYLTLLFRHQLLYALKHLSTGTGLGTTSSVELSTFLLSQVIWIFQDLGIASTIHLQTILPLLRHVMSDPFAVASPELLLQTIKASQSIVVTCWMRVKEHWWHETLRGTVECWVNVHDDVLDSKAKDRTEQLNQILRECRILAALLEDIVGQPFVEAVASITEAKTALRDLFHGDIKQAQSDIQPEHKQLVPKIEEL